MGQKPKKFHITDEGIIYKVEDTGEITELGNVDSISPTNKPSAVSENPSTQDSNIRYSVLEMENLLCNGKGKGLNRFERKLLVKESSNVHALEYFVDFCGIQWINTLITRFEHGETFLEPVLLKVAQNQLGSFYRLASCKRPFSTPKIYHILHNYDIPGINDTLKTNPNTPYYESGFVLPSKKSGGCLGVIILFIISGIAIITTLIY